MRYIFTILFLSISCSVFSQNSIIGTWKGIAVSENQMSQWAQEWTFTTDKIHLVRIEDTYDTDTVSLPYQIQNQSLKIFRGDTPIEFEIQEISEARLIISNIEEDIFYILERENTASTKTSNPDFPYYTFFQIDSEQSDFSQYHFIIVPAGEGEQSILYLYEHEQLISYHEVESHSIFNEQKFFINISHKELKFLFIDNLSNDRASILLNGMTKIQMRITPKEATTIFQRVKPIFPEYQTFSIKTANNDFPYLYLSFIKVDNRYFVIFQHELLIPIDVTYKLTNAKPLNISSSKDNQFNFTIPTVSYRSVDLVFDKVTESEISGLINNRIPFQLKPIAPKTILTEDDLYNQTIIQNDKIGWFKFKEPKKAKTLSVGFDGLEQIKFNDNKTGYFTLYSLSERAGIDTIIVGQTSTQTGRVVKDDFTWKLHQNGEFIYLFRNVTITNEEFTKQKDITIFTMLSPMKQEGQFVFYLSRMFNNPMEDFFILEE